MRSLGRCIAATIVAGAALVATAAGRSAVADGAGRTRTIRLRAASGAHSAAGVARVRETRSGQRIVVRLRHLEPLGAYEVRDDDDGRILGTATADARGRAKVSLGDAAPAAKPSSLADVDGVVVTAKDTGDDVLAGRWRRSYEIVAVGVAAYDSPSGAAAAFRLFSLPDAGEEWVVFDLFTPTDDGWLHAHRLVLSDAELPLGATRVAQLGGTAFDVRDARGTVVVAGRVPAMEPPRRTEVITFRKPRHDGGIAPGEPLYFLRLLDEAGAVTETHPLTPDPETPPAGRR